MTEASEILKAARGCHTKQAWEAFAQKFNEPIKLGLPQKAQSEIFRLLARDSLSTQYSSDIWHAMMLGCLATWNLELGSMVADHIATSPVGKIAIAAARIYAEKGFPLKARKIATRTLRLNSLSTLERLEVEVLICQSYMDDGKRSMAIRLSNKIQQGLASPELPAEQKAQFFSQLARINFFLGRYPVAGRQFQDSYELFKTSSNWYEAARAVYNAGSSYFSAGGRLQENAFPLVEECRRISEKNKFWGPLSHVEAFYGHDDYWHGNFAGARDHYRRAHKYIPSSDKSFRTLHVLSMLTFIYLRTGQLALAKKFGEKTLSLAEQDQSQRFRSRYHNLKAEIMWVNGDIEQSQQFLIKHVSILLHQGVNTLEELSTLSRYFWQASQLGQEPILQKVRISEQLKKNTGDWLEYLNAEANLLLSLTKYEKAELLFCECLNKAKTYGDKYHLCLANLGLIKLRLAQGKVGNKSGIDALLKDLEISAARLVETPIKLHLHIVRAALSYQRGDFEATKLHLISALNSGRMCPTEEYVVHAWNDTVNGKSVRVTYPWQRAVLSSMTRMYFKPKFEYTGERSFTISEHYKIDLKNHPQLADLIIFLLQRTKFLATPQEVQLEVWKQSLHQQGWKQKIRNTIMRLRDLLPHTIAPLVIHHDEIGLFSEAIEIKAALCDQLNTKEEILRLLQQGPMSTVHLSNRLNVSSATTKRVLKKLSEEERITVMKLGRQVLYQALGGNDSDKQKASKLCYPFDVN